LQNTKNFIFHRKPPSVLCRYWIIENPYSYFEQEDRISNPVFEKSQRQTVRLPPKM
jgi:hypothetical protein